ncbi:uncharacterized protein TNCV_1868011 [Trichonephila clavipes]|nr:uncharacterized protein TNCV_1868011 [Trichonephila clavipes]
MLIFNQSIDLKLMQCVLAIAHHNVWSMHDAHFSIALLYHLHASYPERWIGYVGPVTWRPRYLDLNPLDFFFGHLKSLVCKTPVTTVDDSMARIVVTLADTISTPDLFKRVRQSFIRCRRKCYDLRGSNFEKFRCHSHVVAFLASSFYSLFIF